MTPRWQVAFLTGQSDPQGCALSPSQQRFVAAFAASAAVDRNFPYADDTPAFRAVPLWRASIANARQYLDSRGVAFRRRHRPAVEALLARRDRSLLLAGSCGLELLVNLQLPRDLLDRVAVFAYGPVARRRPDCDCLLLQGHRDLLSRWYFPQADVRVAAGHMDYLAQADVLQHCRAFFAARQAAA
ncbi:hypothetical protein [Tahibacter caeni]|uniref:hypothetical protein n=1 Tax=Tahibacter caeni TaxID=1453545 RepID=UPI0021489673|nr:hypothetical protein [Tahibacter caeni]